MPVIMDGSHIPVRWAGKKISRPSKSAHSHAAGSKCLDVALINNMPDSALEDTELQFSELLDAAAGEIPIRLRFYSLPSIARSARVRERLNNCYFDIDDLLRNRFDGVIITGTEPRRPDMREEPYWPALVEVLEWAELNTASAVLSCVAAHAAVLHSDGIARHALSDKRFGVFSERSVHDHALTRGAGSALPFPHSRWNEVREEALTAAGYTVLTKSNEAGVNLFVKQKRESLFVHFQGHPEYGARTLLKEYRRDVGRFLKQERANYPCVPHAYFDAASTKLLNEFQENAQSHPRKELMAEFPEDIVARTLQVPWRSAAVLMYSNWLEYVASRKADKSTVAPVARPGHR
jgi:homoserine O-succinyltransferase